MSHEVGTSERTYVKLKSAIMTGTLNAQSRLDFAELAADLGVSTTPVREAVMRLLGEGLLEQHPNGGARPLRLSEFRLRGLLDVHAKLILASISGAALPEETAAHAITNEQRARLLFHKVAQRSGNPELVDMVGRLSDRLTRVRVHEDEVLFGVAEELDALRVAIHSPALLRRLVRAYHRRRLASVAKLVWLTNSMEGDRSRLIDH